MKKKIIFIIESTFNQRDYKRFGIEILQKRGYEVFIYDLTPLFRLNYFNNYVPPESFDNKSFQNYFLFYDKTSFIKVLNDISENDIVINVLGITKDNIFILEKLKRNRVKYGFLLLGLIPISNNVSMQLLYSKILSNITRPSKVLQKLRSFHIKKINILSADFLVIGGSKAMFDTRYPIDENTQIIKAHSFDYDKYLEMENNGQPSLIKHDYVVFLDEYVPYHPDYLHSNIKPDCDAENYYPTLNEFLRLVEEKFNINVIIAAHPRADYQKIGNPFDGRKIMKNESISLIKYSKFVIAHASTAISYAVLYNKPILFIKFKKYSKRYKLMIETMANEVGKSTIELSKINSIDWDNELTNDKFSYELYKKDYIKEPCTPNKFIWEIFADYCDRISQIYLET